MDTKRFFRYLAPNLVTLASLLFGMMSIVSSVRGEWAWSAWFIVFSVLTDKLDGFVARLVKGASEFGVQLDSFADFLNFGIAPATLWYTFLSRPESVLAGQKELVALSCILWVLAVTFRLARYNIVGDDPKCKRIFFGCPTTLVGGTLTALFLTFLKYGAAGDAGGAMADDPRLLVGLEVGPSVWWAWPPLMMVGAFLMASTFRIPKLGLSRSKPLTIFIFLNVFAGYALGATMHVPEYLCFTASLWIVVSIVWGMVKADVRALKAPPIFPRHDLPPSKMPQRPEEDALPEEDEEAPPEAPAPSPVRSARG